MSKQTALDWLKQQLESYGDPQCCKVTWEDFDILIEQALQMERKQIVEVWNDGNYNYFYNRVGRKEFEDGNEYYNETYGGQDE